MHITPTLRKQITDDIDLCIKHDGVDGSEQLFGELVSRYSVLDPEFNKNLSTAGKVAVLGQQFDYRPELRAIASKLKMYLMLGDDEMIDITPEYQKIDEFIRRGEDIRMKEYHPAGDGFPLSYIGGPLCDVWMNEIYIYNDRHLQAHPLHDSIQKTCLNHRKNPDAFEKMIGYLHALSKDKEYFEKTVEHELEGNREMNKKVFVVHGHDQATLATIARTLERSGLEAIILHEQADEGLTIIEKFEKHSDVAFGVVLYTECDVGREITARPEDEKPRARQNVVFEHGYLIAKLGRENVCALVKGNIETPGDLEGVIYIKMDTAGAWKSQLAKNMKAAGLSFNLEKFVL